ncbi:DNA-binding SARP family transcriptional activator/DNA-binding CsgD family transcriptional regulator [Crossiella equi]|uniref:DNA-binding SARP family transcriptional activator/DNA-binding CsgD family transcriptional regulator n=2 Tax=Crossiella equi TaxID=130796 RepID=A0ABS5ARN5_9PSEU|nr:BTAD domain-containing putative transcriptional regulator [Crossiella equi]MBP2479242.1 DNA-binding SARP family transcriptional activator/DNA-binding CsgD family transcriptional regulator [Crossiella equi]
MSGPSGLRVEVLGPLRAVVAGREAGLGPARQRAVFAILVAGRGRVVPREEIVAGVWGSTPPVSARGSLYTYVSGLRRGLGTAADHLISTDIGYALAPVEVDLAEFDRLRLRADRDGGVEAVTDLDAALRLWRGEPYGGVPGPFAAAERARLTELGTQVREQRAAVLLATGGDGDLVAELAALVREHPLRERLRVLLMTALARSGRQAEALEVFQDASRLLRTELGVGPGPELRAAHERLLHGEPVSPPLAPRPASRAAPPAPAPPVGREAEAELLRRAVRELAETGAGRAVWLEGPAGIGKSTLLDTAAEHARALGCQVVHGAADELGSRCLFQVVRDCLEIEVCATDPRRAALAQLLAGAVPASGSLSAFPVLAAVDALFELVGELCREKPLVMVLEDMQWADEATSLVWRRLVEATTTLPLLLFAASRRAPAEVGLLDEGDRHSVLVLGPLSPAASLRLATELRGEDPDLAQLAECSGGNPLYLRELVLAGGPDAPLPATLVEVVRQVGDELGPPARDMLRWAAVLDTELHLPDLVAVTGRTPADLAPLVERAVTAGLLAEVQGSLRFHPPLVRDLVLDSVSQPIREALHRQAAESLLRAGAPVERVAEQLLAAGETALPWTVRWLMAHGGDLSRRAPAVAAALFERALSLPTLPGQDRQELTAALVQVQYVLNREPETRAREVLATTDDPARAAHMRQLLAAMLNRRGSPAEATEVLQEGLSRPDTPRVWWVRHRILRSRIERGTLRDLSEVERWARQAYDNTQAPGEEGPRAHALQVLWHVHSVRRDHEQALSCVDEALVALAGKPELADMHTDMLDNKIFSLQNLDRLAEATDLLRANPRQEPNGLHVAAAVHLYWLGRWSEALIELDSITTEGPAAGYYGLREPGPASLLLHGVAALITGRRLDHPAQRQHLDHAARRVPATRQDRESQDFLVAAKALAASQTGTLHDALTCFRPILDPTYSPLMLRHQWLPCLVYVAQEAQDHATAEQAAALAESEAEAEHVPARAHAAHLRCQALTTGDLSAAWAAADHYRKVNRPLELADTLLELAELHARQGHPTDARHTLTAATDIFHSIGATWDIRRAESIVSRHNLHRPHHPRPAAEGWPSLTPVETRIATLAAANEPNPTIAERLGLPRRAVEAYLTRILAKLRVESRADLAAVVRRHTGG